MQDSNETARLLREAIRRSGLSYMELERRTGIAKSSIQRYANGQTRKIPADAIERLAKVTGMQLSDVFGSSAPDLHAPDLTEQYVTFPVLGEIAAGYGGIALEDWEGDRIDIPVSYLHGRAPEEFFVLCVKGESMYPAYQDGDRVLILKKQTLDRSGQVGAVLFDDDRATLKRVEFVMGEDWMRLVPINPNIPPTLIEGERLEHCRILGVPRLVIREVDD